MSRAPGQPFVAIPDTPVFGPPARRRPQPNPARPWTRWRRGARPFRRRHHRRPRHRLVLDQRAAMGRLCREPTRSSTESPAPSSTTSFPPPAECSRPVPPSTATAWRPPCGTPPTGSTGWPCADPGPIFFGAGDHVITSLVDIGAIGSSVGRRARPHRGCWPSAACASARPGNRPRGYRPTAFPGARRRRAFPSTTSRRTAREPSPMSATGADGLLYAAGGSPGRQRLWQSDQRPGMVGGGPPGGRRPRHRLAPRPGRGRRAHDRTGRQPPGPALRPGPTERVLARAERDRRVRQPSPHGLADQPRQR